VAAPLDRDTDNAPGSLLTRQWPEMRHIFQSSEFTELLDETALVSEKLDGSNVAVSSRGFASSRRNILLNRPDPTELEKFKFSGQKLVNAFSLVPKLQLLEKRFESLLSLSLEVIIYGELIQKGTATSKEDKYGYAAKGYSAGDLYVFGCGIVFDVTQDSDQMRLAWENLWSKGFNPTLETDPSTNRQYLILLMNPNLREFLAASGVNNFIQQTPLTLNRVIEEYTQKLVNNDIEGVVLVFNGHIFKWKGVEESYPDLFIQQISDLYKVLRFTKPSGLGVIEKILEVATAARKIRIDANAAKQDKLTDQHLETAYNSAVSKFSRLEDDISQSSESRHTILSRHSTRIRTEMLKDANSNSEFMKSIDAFIRKKVEQYRTDDRNIIVV